MKSKFTLIVVLTSLVNQSILSAQGTWTAVGTGINSPALAMTEYNGSLYVGKLNFMTPDDIIKWNGSSFSNVGLGTNGPVGAFLKYNNDLFVAGGFTTAGGQMANDVSKWNGSSWSSVGSPLDNFSINALAEYNGDLYAAGYGVNAGGIVASLYTIAKWDGTTWSPLDSGLQGGDVFALAVYNGELYAAGSFTNAGSLITNHIAKWNGTSWSAVGTGVIGNLIYTLAVYDGQLYAGGAFSVAGGVNASCLAKWDGTNWSSVGLGTDNTIVTLTDYNNELYIGGAFSIAGGAPANHIVKWNGTNWSTLGNGIGAANNPNEQVWCITPYNNSIYVAGTFAAAGGVSGNIAQWTTSTSVADISSANIEMNIYPNPIQHNSVLEFNVSNKSNINIDVYNSHGCKINSSNTRNNVLGKQEYLLDELIDFCQGEYFLVVTIGDNRYTKSIVVE